MRWVLIGFISIITIFLYFTNNLKETYQIQLESTETHNKFKTIMIDGQVVIEMSFDIAVTEDFHYVLPRAAYFDKRSRGKHKNATVLLTHMTSNVKLVACKINNYTSRAFQVKPLKVNKWIRQKFSDCTHDNVLIFCYDSSGQNNSDVFIVYKNPENESELISVKSEYPLFIPQERKSHSSVMVCTTVFDTPPHFGAWIRYQKTLGVDMIHINAQESFLSSHSFNDTFFLESLRNGFIQLQVWKEHLPPGATFYHSQALFYQDCLYRYIGVYDYCMCVDTDDFLVSMDNQNSGIHQLVGKLFSHKQTNSASLHWIRYLERKEGFIDPPELETLDGNLTKYINTSTHEDEGFGRTKSIYRLSAMVELGIHESVEFLSSKQTWKQFSHIHVTTAYVAHIKKNRRAMDKKLRVCSDV